MAGSIVPDAVEFPLGPLVKHRGITHTFPIYAVPAGLFGVLYVAGYHFVCLYLCMLFVGALLHLVEDGMSTGGVSLWPLKRKMALGYYKTFRSSEQILVMAMAAVNICIAYMFGYFDPHYVSAHSSAEFTRIFEWASSIVR
jgi:membrane-bound metal-dependent hydrolase YbcI (DUF457 family)